LEKKGKSLEEKRPQSNGWGGEKKRARKKRGLEKEQKPFGGGVFPKVWGHPRGLATGCRANRITI